jgi:hypothetical protein
LSTLTGSLIDESIPVLKKILTSFRWHETGTENLSRDD